MRPPAAVCCHGDMSTEGGADLTCYARFVSVAPDRNRARSYSLTRQPVRWGGALTRTWSRLPGSGRSLTRFYADRASAQPGAERLIARRGGSLKRPGTKTDERPCFVSRVWW